MHVAIVSTSLHASSRSRALARMCVRAVSERQVSHDLLDLSEIHLPKFDNGTVFDSPEYDDVHSRIRNADALVLCSPVYNWGMCAELKGFVEAIGSTPRDGRRKGAFFDKVVTFVNSAGSPHAYMAFASMATSMMMDFKCIINPYHVYVHDEQWDGDQLAERSSRRLEKSMDVAVQLANLLTARTYTSAWEI